MNSLVEQIEARAAAANLTIKEVCSRAGIAQSTFTRWKSDKHEPNLRKYRAVVRVLDELDVG